MKNKEIVNIRVEHIHPHPENPRKDLGDLSELAESIMKKGILQNLTIIPIEDAPGEYTAIIGHRRHAAAMLAGILEVPCVIVEGMSKKEQLSTMLEENIQRNDLTIIEQAQGFQLMLDLGETAQTIAEKTGFSQTTIRHRLNLAKLNQKELKKKEQDDSFQLTLKDLYSLEKIEDIKTRNKILSEATNSRELIWKAQNAINQAERNKKQERIVNMLQELGIDKASKKAENEQYSGKWDLVKEFDLEKDVPKQLRLPKRKDTLFYLTFYRSVRVIKKAKKEERELTPEEIAEKQINKNRKEIKHKLKIMDANRKEFIQNIISGKINAVKNEGEIREIIWGFLLKAGGYLSQSVMMKMYLDKMIHECSVEERNEALQKINSLSFTHSMLVSMHCSMENISDICDRKGYYISKTGSKLLYAYKALKPYGWTFQNDDDEKILDGTHELYSKIETIKES